MLGLPICSVVLGLSTCGPPAEQDQFSRDQLLWTGWLDSLSIGQVGKDFSSDSPDQTWAKWIEAAFAMASAIATGNDLNRP